MKKRCPPTIKLQGRLVLNAGPKEPRLRPSIVLCHEVIHEWLFLKFSCRRQKARKMGHCVQSLASDLKPWEMTIIKSPSSWLDTLPKTYKVSSHLLRKRIGEPGNCQGTAKVGTWEMQSVVIIMHSVDVKDQSGIFVFLIKASLSFPANLGTPVINDLFGYMPRT